MFTAGYPDNFLNLTQASEITAFFSEFNLIYKLQRILTHMSTLSIILHKLQMICDMTLHSLLL